MITQQFIPEFDDQLEEGELYAMVNFSIKVNVGKWKAASHPCRFYFSDSTKIKRQSNDKHPLFPLTPYRFTPFLDVLKHPDIDAPDLIGKITIPIFYFLPWFIFFHMFYLPKLIHHLLLNHMSLVPTTLKKNLKSLQMVHPLGPVSTYVIWKIRCCIVLYGTSTLIKWTVICLPQDRTPLLYCPSYVASTKDGVIQRALQTHFTSLSCCLTNIFPRFMAMSNSTSQPSSLSSSSGISVADETRTISQLHSTKEVRSCWFYGEVSSILSWKSWAYLGCYDPIFFKKVVKDNGEFVCSKCETRFLDRVWRYSLRLRVKHKRSYADIILWDGKSQRLIGKAVGEFLDHIDVDKLVPKSCPDEISSLVGREFVFKIDRFQINPSGGGKLYSINMISENKSKIEQLKSADGSDSEQMCFGLIGDRTSL